MAQIGVKNHNDLHTELRSIRREINVLRSLVVSLIGEDREGSYRPSFVKAILEAAGEKPIHKFISPTALLSKLKRA